MVRMARFASTLSSSTTSGLLAHVSTREKMAAAALLSLLNTRIGVLVTEGVSGNETCGFLDDATVSSLEGVANVVDV